MTTTTGTITEASARVATARHSEALAPEPLNTFAGARLQVDAATRMLAIQRLRGAAGHLEGVLRMLQQSEVHCVDVLQQLKAVHGALAKVSGHVLRSHLRHHVVTASDRGDADRILAELAEALKYGL